MCGNILKYSKPRTGGGWAKWERNCQNDKFKHNSENGNEFCPEPEMSFHGYELNINENVNRRAATARTTPNFKWIFFTEFQIQNTKCKIKNTKCEIKK